MTTDTPSLQRKPPARGDLTAVLRTLLTAVRLPCAEPEAERDCVVGFRVTAEPEGSTVLEWFISKVAWAVAATEQTNVAQTGKYPRCTLVGCPPAVAAPRSSMGGARWLRSTMLR